MKVLLINVLSLVIAGGMICFCQNEQPDLDQQVLDQLKKAGSDLSKPHNIDFFLYFPTDALANEAAKEVGTEVDRLRIQRGAGTADWLCLANKRMVPKHEELVRLRKRFNEIVRRYDGEYDGWGAQVEK